MEEGDVVTAVPAGASSDAGDAAHIALHRDSVLRDSATADLPARASSATTDTPDAARSGMATPDGVSAMTAASAATSDTESGLAPPRSGSVVDRRTEVAELMRTYGNAVHGFCARILRDGSLADDVTQQVFLEAYRDFDRFERRGSPRSWLFAIASNRCVDLIRRESNRSRWTENGDGSVTEIREFGASQLERLDRARLSVALDECIALLSPEVRTTVLMRFQTGLTYEQLSAALDARAEALQLRVVRALRKLRACLEHKGWTGE